MSAYQATPFKAQPALLVAGTPQYLFGSFDDRSAPTQGYVKSNSAVTTTGTLTFQIVGGNIPKVGDLITVVGCANSANFNVTNVAIASVVNTTAAGLCTVTYAISSTTQGTVADNGLVIVPRPEVAEATLTGKSVPVAFPFNPATPQQGRTITVNVSFATGTTAGVLALQGANFDIDSEYVTLVPSSTSGTTPGINATGVSGTAVYSDAASNYRFYRFIITTTISGGAAPGVVAKIVA